MTPRVLDGVDGVLGAVGDRFGPSDWTDVTADRLDAFAESVGSDDAVEYLAVSLTNRFLPQIVEVRGFAAGVNYGVAAIEFGRIIAAGDRVRADALLVEVAELDAGIQTEMLVMVEIEGADEPACRVRALSRWLY